jgi:hypothetical protein
MGGHVDKGSFIRRGIINDNVSGDSLFHGALYVGAGKRSGDSLQLLFAASYSVFDNGSEKMNLIRGEMLGDLDDINYLQKLHGQLQRPRKKARVGQNFFRGL